MSIEINDFGKLENGNIAKIITLKNSNNITAKLTNYGAILVSLFVPDKNGEISDVVLGFDSIEKYENGNIPCFGATVGRNSNRIGNASFSLNGEIYHIDKNERNKNNLHSGFNQYKNRLWNYNINEENNSVIFSMLSPDGDQGFPGNFNVSVTYTLTNDNELKIEYKGISDKDTIANMTNHSYFNLAGHNGKTAIDEDLYINADKFLEVDEESIPTGNMVDVTNTPMDFRIPKKISLEIEDDFSQLKLTSGYDHSYVLNKPKGSLEKIATLSDNVSGRKMDVYTDCVAVQFYAGNFIESCKTIGKENCTYKNRSGVCLETGFLPDSINKDNFDSPILKAGDEYHSITIYKFSF